MNQWTVRKVVWRGCRLIWLWQQEAAVLEKCSAKQFRANLCSQIHIHHKAVRDKLLLMSTHREQFFLFKLHREDQSLHRKVLILQVKKALICQFFSRKELLQDFSAVKDLLCRDFQETEWFSLKLMEVLLNTSFRLVSQWLLTRVILQLWTKPVRFRLKLSKE